MKVLSLVNLQLFPILGVISTGALVGIALLLDAGLSNIAQQSQYAANHNSCVYMILNMPSDKKPAKVEMAGIAGAVRYCNGSN